MKNNILCVSSWLVATAFAASLATAHEFKEEETAASAKWIFHLDLDAMKKTQIGQGVMQMLRTERAQRRLAGLKQALNLDPLEDIASVTNYGTSADPHAAVALIRGHFDPERIHSLAGQNGTIDHKDKRIHTWERRGHEVHGAVHSDQLVVLGADLELLKTALDVVARSAASFEAPDLLENLVGDKAPVVTAFVNLDILEDIDLKSTLARKIRTFAMAIDEVDGRLAVSVKLEAGDADSAAFVEGVFSNLLEYAESSGKIPSALVEAIKTDVEGDRLTISATLDIETVVAMAFQFRESMRR